MKAINPYSNDKSYSKQVLHNESNPVNGTGLGKAKNENPKMSKNRDKYYHKGMDKTAGIEHTYHRTKIVATVGPACDTYEKLLELVKCGVNVFRLNFSHGSHEDKIKIIEYIREINTSEPYNISILGDLQGPKLR